jgi:hypothetical protein
MEEDANCLELKVLPTQPDHPAIPEEEGDDEDAHERVVGDEAGVEVSLGVADMYILASYLRFASSTHH